MSNHDRIISLTLSLIKSDFINVNMKPAYISFLKRYLSKKEFIHDDEVSYIEQEIKRHTVKVDNYTEVDATNYLEKHNEASSRQPERSESKSNQLSSSKNNQKNDYFDYQKEIEILKETITELRHKGKIAVASRDKWKKRAESAESRLKENGMGNDLKFKKVKMNFSKMYHPDSVAGTSFEKLQVISK